jgi:hypothetical protein
MAFYTVAVDSRDENMMELEGQQPKAMRTSEWFVCLCLR